MKKRSEERTFLAQLLDGSQVENYVLPVQINAELRKYQQEGVNWLAFLRKYQLHGILCDGRFFILFHSGFDLNYRRHGTWEDLAIHLHSCQCSS